MRLPNGVGSVHKLSGKRRKPWAVRKTESWEFYYNGTNTVAKQPSYEEIKSGAVAQKRTYKYIGYYKQGRKHFKRCLLITGILLKLLWI